MSLSSHALRMSLLKSVAGLLLILVATTTVVAETKYPPTVDLSGDVARQIVIAEGTEKIYQGHPTTLLSSDARSILATWCLNHGGACGPLKRSDDGGKTWGELLPTPASWATVKNCPVLMRLPDPQGKETTFVFAGQGPDGAMHSAQVASRAATL